MFDKLSSKSSPTSFLAIGLMLVLLVMILPVPPWVLDVGLTLSFALAVLVFITALFIGKPLDFSSFPSVLLACLILRLALNVSSTKLIIGEGHTGTAAAGGVIEGFAMFVMGGNLFVGLVVFGVLIIVNFMVITKGAGRMAEVGARFALDAMPGKQLAIDSDLAVGAISHNEARQRRKLEQEEASFLGSLDGASKFVKGDAIAGLLITFLNLIAGIGFGLIAHGLTFTEALNNYSILTVGDGLVSQIPAVIVSVAAALILSKSKEEGSIDKALGAQLIGNGVALGIVAAILFVFALVPGLPFVPFMAGAAGFGMLGYIGLRDKPDEVEGPAEEEAPAKAKPIGDVIQSDEIHLEVAPDLVGLIIQGEQGFETRIDKIRRYIAEEYGIVLPPIRMTDNPVLEKNTYAIRIQGVVVDKGLLRPGAVLAIIEDDQLPHLLGDRVEEPVYKVRARWVSSTHRQELTAAGVPAVEAMEVLATHVLEVVQSSFSLIFTRSVMLDTLDALTSVSDGDRAALNKRLFDDFIPAKVSHETLLPVLRALLDERVPVRNLEMILEAIAEAKGLSGNPTLLAEHVRQRLSFQIVERHSDPNGRLPLIQLGPHWEERFASHELKGENGQSDIALPPEMFAELVTSIQTKLNDLAKDGKIGVVATSSRRRKFLRTVLSSKGIRNAVLAYEEIGHRSQPYIAGVA